MTQVIKPEGRVNEKTQIGKSTDLLRDLSFRLNELRDHWIFDWPQYRDLIGEVFQRALESLEKTPESDHPLVHIEELFHLHSRDIFNKGYNHKILKLSSHDVAVRISVSGLQRFLDLPFEFYSSVARSTPDSTRGLAARRVYSSMLIGILLGYGETRFGDQTGWQLLERNGRSWFDSLAFLMPKHIHKLLVGLEVGSFRDSLRDVVAPVFDAIDRVIGSAPKNQLPLPISGEYEPRVNRLGVILELPGISDQLGSARK